MKFEKGDIICVTSHTLFGKSIRFFSKSPKEFSSIVNHVGLIVSDSNTLGDAIVIESLNKVKRHTMRESYSKRNCDIYIFRAIDITPEEIDKIIEKANSYVGDKYGYLKIVTHTLDWFIGGAYVFRRLTNSDNYPICSWLVAHSYAVVGKTFGVDAGAATPDDIFDFCVRTNKYTSVGRIVYTNKDCE